MKNKITLSAEQRLFINKALENHNILVDACIGSGKTTAIQHLCNEIPNDKKVLYLTYNKLLKLDAKSKIMSRNVTVTNYHGFAYMCLAKQNIRAGISDLIQTFINSDIQIPRYDILVIDEYQDIEEELSIMLDMIKESNPKLQIIAVGDMEQKIYDKTTLNVPAFINKFLGKHIRLEFTQCFRLSADYAEKLGRIWSKKIVGVNPSCNVSIMDIDNVQTFLANQDTKDILCLGARTGNMSKVLNWLEEMYSNKFNKHTVYASIQDEDGGCVNPSDQTAIFTTYDASKGLERKICIIFDFAESYWKVRVRKPQVKYDILRNIFLVAASRGKQQIIFVKPSDQLLSERTLSTRTDESLTFEDMSISQMFDFKYKEDVEECYRLLKIKEIRKKDKSNIDIPAADGMIDLSPCIGTYQEAVFFDGYNIDNEIDLAIRLDPDRKIPEGIKKATLEEKILFLAANETKQNRYTDQVTTPFVNSIHRKRLCERLAAEFSPAETVQQRFSISFEDNKGKNLFYAIGIADVIKDDVVYELKFVSDLKHEHFLQLATYLIGLNKKKGRLWNVKTNTMYEVTIPNRAKYMDAVARTVTKGYLEKYKGDIMDRFADKTHTKKTVKPKTQTKRKAVS